MHLTSFLQDGHLTIALTGEIDHHCAKAYIGAITSKIKDRGRFSVLTAKGTESSPVLSP